MLKLVTYLAQLIKPGCTAATLVCGLCMALLATLALPALAAVPPTSNAIQERPRLASMLVDIWPEYDRKAVLIILKGELPADTPLPAVVSLRLPAAVGAPAAVAYSETAGSNLFNLQHEVKGAGNFSAVQFSTPQRFFHVEYYDTLSTGLSARTYTYTWTGDLRVDRLSIRIQEPTGANDLSVEPDFGPGSSGPEGLFYRTLAYGAVDAGKQLPVAIRYTKTDSRTSVEMLKLNAPVVGLPTPAKTIDGQPPWVWILIAVAGLMMALVALWWLWRRRQLASGVQSGGAKFCTKCGGALAPGNRYCPSCGTPAQQSQDSTLSNTP